MSTRNDTGRIIKDAGSDFCRFREVSKYSYGDILRNINETFVTDADGSMQTGWNGRIRNLRLIASGSGDVTDMWYHRLTDAVPSEEQVYLILEDEKGVGPEYRIYEAYPAEIVTMLDEMNNAGEFYIVSEKYIWLIFCTPNKAGYCTGDIRIN